jgi:hypothetical protein
MENTPVGDSNGQDHSDAPSYPEGTKDLDAHGSHRYVQWRGKRTMRHFAKIVLTAFAVAACAQSAVPDLSTALKGITKAKFLSCSGPPLMTYPQSGQDQMAFVTNLKRGQEIGISGVAEGPADSCSVNAVFDHDRLVSSAFSGNEGMCQLVFGPCLGQ